MLRENFEYVSEYEWNLDRKSEHQRRCGLIALGLFVFVLVSVVALVVKSL